MLEPVRAYRPFFARWSAATGCAVLALDYRSAPEHLLPVAPTSAGHIPFRGAVTSAQGPGSLPDEGRFTLT